MVKEKVEIIFVVLLYRTAEDLLPFIKSIERTATYTYKVIVVNSYYDEISLKKIHQISRGLSCDFVAVENKGYGYGNNKGIEFALKKYDFDYLIISNSDIEIEKFEYKKLNKNKAAIYGLNIITDNGKSQNPYWAKEYTVCERWIYEGLKYHKKNKIIVAQALNRIRREIFLFFKGRKKETVKVFALHGSFVIFNKKIFDIIGLPYDEEMFLFSEEACLAHKLKKQKIDSYYIPSSLIHHHEDGSTKGTNIKIKHHATESVIHYYEKYVLGK